MVSSAATPHARTNLGFPDLGYGKSTELAQVQAHLVRIEAKLDALSAKPKPNLTRVKFAELADMHPNTVGRKIKAGLIRTEKGLIPRSELAKFVS
jgi:hypothetical protein